MMGTKSVVNPVRNLCRLSVVYTLKYLIPYDISLHAVFYPFRYRKHSLELLKNLQIGQKHGAVKKF